MLAEILQAMRPTNRVQIAFAVLAPPAYLAVKGMEALPPDTRLAVAMPVVYGIKRAGQALVNSIQGETAPIAAEKIPSEVIDFGAAAE
jgi:hypothetical protein